jgi:hypothetical protein
MQSYVLVTETQASPYPPPPVTPLWVDFIILKWKMILVTFLLVKIKNKNVIDILHFM